MAVIVAEHWNETLSGTAGDDSITGSPGADYVHGHQGNDTIVSATAFGDDGTPDTLRGGAGDDVISLTYGYGGLLFGDNGDDTLSQTDPSAALGGSALLEGGPGDDLLRSDGGPKAHAWAGYITATGGVTVSLAETAPQAVGGGAGVDTLLGLNGVVGSAFDDVIHGGAGGADDLFGGPGNDRIEAGSGGGVLHGDTGDDTLVGGVGSDWADYSASPVRLTLGLPDYAASGGVHVDLGVAGPQDVGGGLGRDVLIDIDNLRGGTFSDTLAGDAGANILQGLAGDDSLSGGAGDDSLEGLYGVDTLAGGAGADTLSDLFQFGLLKGGDGDDRISSGDGGYLEGNQGADTLLGGFGADTIRGGQGNDTISGGAGDDWLSGDRGDDTISGGAGADTFHTFAGAGVDRVTDFNAAEGDHVLLFVGTSYSVSQVGADVVVTLPGGDQMVLVGVQLSALPSGWIGFA